MSDLSAQYRRTLEAIERLTKQLTQIKADHQREIQPLQHNLDTLWSQAITMEETLSGVKVGDVRQGTDELFEFLRKTVPSYIYNKNTVEHISRWYATFQVTAIKVQDDKQLVCLIETPGKIFATLPVWLVKDCQKVESK